MVLGAFIFLKEPFSIQKIIGTVVIILGITIALWKKRKFKINNGVFLVILATFFYAGMDLISYYIVRDFDAISFIVYVCYLPVITLLLVRPQTIRKLAYYLKAKYALCVSVLSLSDTVGSICTFYAYQIGRNVAQIAPLMGLITIISVLLAIVFLKERSNLLNKIIGALVVVVGALLVL